MDVKKLMIDALEDLVDEDFKRFNWQLWNGLEADIIPIPRAQLQRADRTDVVDRMVDNYSDNAGKIAVQALRNINQNHRANILESKLQGGLQSEPVDRSNASMSAEDQPIQTDWQRPLIKPSTQQFKSTILREHRNDVYIPKDISQRKRLALLITNIQFKHLTYRDGAERDEENMEWLLTALGYSVEKYTNLTGQEIDARVRNFAARSDPEDSDSTFVVLMSHGDIIRNKDAIVGVDYHPQRNPNDVFFVDDIFSHLNSKNCSALVDKPKVILIQACRGGHSGTVQIQSDAIVHIEKDFVCFKSCLPDISAWRNRTNGSYFIMYIVEVFCNWAHNDDIMELFRKVTSRMEKDTSLSADGKLMPCIDRVSLAKKLYLFPGL